MNPTYNSDALDKHPAFDSLRELLRNPNTGSMDIIDHFIRAGTDISALLKHMYNLAVDINAKTIVELGVRWGNSTVILLLSCFHNGGHVYSVDIEDCHVANSIVTATGLKEYWTFTQMNDIDYANVWTNRASKGQDTNIDFLFIDTDHTYELTRKELDKYSGFVKKDGIILFHDSYMEGVVKGYTEFLMNHHNWISMDDDKYMPLSGKVIKRIK